MAEAGRNVILEFQTIGNSVKVTAIDPESLVEVSLVGSGAVRERRIPCGRSAGTCEDDSARAGRHGAEIAPREFRFSAAVRPARA